MYMNPGGTRWTVILVLKGPLSLSLSKGKGEIE